MNMQEQIHVKQVEKDVGLDKVLERLPAQDTLIDDIWKLILKVKRILFGY